MKKIFLSFCVALLLFPHLVSAAVTFDINKVRAVIDSNDSVQVNKNIILDASKSFLPNKKSKTTYEWDLGDKTALKSGVEIVHSYKKPGKYLVKLTVSQLNLSSDKKTTVRETNSITKEVFAYDKLMLFLTDVTDKKASIKKLSEKALTKGTYINIIESYNSTTAFMSEEALSKKLASQAKTINSANVIAIWTTRGRDRKSVV